LPEARAIDDELLETLANGAADDCERALAEAEEYTSEQPQFSLGSMHYANVLGRLGRRDDARAAVERSLQHNPLMTPLYYAELMTVLTDQPAVVDKRTSGLTSAGIL
jgi:hypothetical protein